MYKYYRNKHQDILKLGTISHCHRNLKSTVTQLSSLISKLLLCSDAFSLFHGNGNAKISSGVCYTTIFVLNCAYVVGSFVTCTVSILDCTMLLTTNANED